MQVVVKTGPLPIVVGVVVDEQGRLLLGKRKSRERQWNGQWELLGGKIHHGETPEEAVIRELREEAGIEVLPTRLLGSFTSVWDLGNEKIHVLILGYSCELMAGTPKPSSAHHELSWFSRDQLPSPRLSGTDEFVEWEFKQPPVASAEPASTEIGDEAATGFANMFG